MITEPTGMLGVDPYAAHGIPIQRANMPQPGASRTAGVLVNGLALLFLPVLGALLLLGKTVLNLPNLHPLMIVGLAGFVLLLPIIHYFDRRGPVGMIWPRCQAASAWCWYLLLAFAIRAQLPRWHRWIFGLVTLVLLASLALSVGRLTRYYGQVPAAQRIAADIAAFIDGTPLHLEQSTHASQLIDRYQADPYCRRSYPHLDPVIAALRHMYCTATTPDQPHPPYEQRIASALAELEGRFPATLDGDLASLLRARLVLARGQIRRNPLEAAQSLITALPPLPEPSHRQRSSARDPSMRTSLQRMHDARDEMLLTTWATVCIVLAEHYGEVDLGVLRRHQIPSASVDDLVRTADSLLDVLATGPSVNAFNQLRTANNRLHFLMWRLRSTAHRLDHRALRPLTPRIDAEVEFSQGERLLRAQLKTAATLASSLPTPEVSLTLAQGHAMLAHSDFHRGRGLKPVPPALLASLDHHLSEVHDHLLIAIRLGWPRETLLPDRHSAPFLSWILSDYADTPPELQALISDARTRIERVLNSKENGR